MRSLKIQIFATDHNGYREKIDDLYWFEENHVHDFDDPFYTFEVIIEGKSYSLTEVQFVPTNAIK